jgi:hypothetical protein
MKLSKKELKTSLKEADILLFRSPNFPRLGWWVAKYTNSNYSHIGLVHFVDGVPHCIEFKEFIGCRIYPLEEYVLEECDKIDVFRTARHFCYDDSMFSFTKDVAHAITTDALKFVGKKYGWGLIFLLVMCYIPIVRFFTKTHITDIENPSVFVCSTFISYLWRKHFVDPVSYLPDSFTKPSDIARSPILKYIFTLSCEDK